MQSDWPCGCSSTVFALCAHLSMDAMITARVLESRGHRGTCSATITAHIGVTWRVARLKHNIPDVDPLVAETVIPPSFGSTTRAGAEPTTSTKRKVKTTQVLEPLDEQEVEIADQQARSRWFDQMRKGKRSLSLEKSEPTSE